MKIMKKVIVIGNGAAIYVPKEYVGREVVVTLPEGLEETRKRLFNKLIEFMPNILGVYLYGSYARNEQNIRSDIDILIIVNERDEKIKNLFDDIDIRILTLKEIKKTIKNFPAIVVPILRESKPFLNQVLLDELKNLKFNIRKFDWHFQDIKRIIKIIENFIELDDGDITLSHVYSLIMRFRILYMIETLLENKTFSNSGVKKILLNRGFSEEDYEKFYYVYQSLRDGEEVKERINKGDVVELIEALKKYLKNIENETKKKIRKRS